MASASSVKPDPKYDIFQTVAQYLDPHLIFPVLNWLGDLGIYNPKDLNQTKYDLAKGTCMVDYMKTTYQDLMGENAPIPEEIVKKEAEISAAWQVHMEAISKFSALFDVSGSNTGGGLTETEAMKELRDSNSFTPEALQDRFGITKNDIESLYQCAKYRFECGDYDTASDFLGVYRALVPTDSERSLNALWGKFASDVVAQRFEDADKDREVLRGQISRAAVSEPGGRLSDAALLQQRSWLLHWSLFVFAVSAETSGAAEKADTSSGNKSGARDRVKDAMVDFFMQDVHLNAIQLNCPWLLRYVLAAVLTSRKRRQLVKSLIRLITSNNYAVSYKQQQIQLQKAAAQAAGSTVDASSLIGGAASGYTDPIVEFLEALLVHFDFEGAQAKLAECGSVIATDFFLSYLTSPAEFLDHARRFVFETYCAINETVELTLLAESLHMTEQEAERWVVDLLRASGEDARIDSTSKQVIFSVNQPNIYQTVIDRTRDIGHRTRVLAEAIDAAVPSSASNEKGYRK